MLSANLMRVLHTRMARLPNRADSRCHLYAAASILLRSTSMKMPRERPKMGQQRINRRLLLPAIMLLYNLRPWSFSSAFPSIYPMRTSAAIRQRRRLFDATNADQQVSLEEMSDQSSSHDSSWRRRFEELRKFQSEHGHCLVPQKCKEYPKLGPWVHYQRQRGDSSLTATQLQALEQLGFCWNVHDHYWKTMLDELCAFRAQHGHVHVPRSQNPKLYNWVQNQLGDYRLLLQGMHGASAKLTPERLEALQAVGLFDGYAPQEHQWKRRFDELCAYRAQHGHVRVPRSHKQYPKLYNWVQNQLREYRLFLQGLQSASSRKLTPERLEALEAVGLFDDYTPRHTLWEDRYQELQAFVATHGHALVPENYCDNIKLGIWVMNQRSQYKRYLAGKSTTLTPERIEALEEIGFCWNVRHYQWFQMLERLREYQKQHGNLEIDPWDKSNKDLRLWLSGQRHEYNKLSQKNSLNQTSPLDTRRIEALQEIPDFTWKSRNTTSPEGPSASDWAKLFEGIREKGITPEVQPKQHWFEGQNRFEVETKDTWTEEDLMDLWNQEDDDEDEYYIEDDELEEGDY